MSELAETRASLPAARTMSLTQCVWAWTWCRSVVAQGGEAAGGLAVVGGYDCRGVLLLVFRGKEYESRGGTAVAPERAAEVAAEAGK